MTLNISLSALCSCCHTHKSTSDFHQDSRRGLQRWCKDCKRIRGRKYDSKLSRKQYFRMRETLPKRKQWIQNYKKTNPHARLRYYANARVNNALVSVKLARQPCEQCGAARAHAHHDNYEEHAWLNIRWLCPEHHKEWHSLNIPIFPLL